MTPVEAMSFAMYIGIGLMAVMGLRIFWVIWRSRRSSTPIQRAPHTDSFNTQRAESGGKHLFVRFGESDTPVQVPGLLPGDTDMVNAMAYLCGYTRNMHPEIEHASVLTLELKDASPGVAR